LQSQTKRELTDGVRKANKKKIGTTECRTGAGHQDRRSTAGSCKIYRPPRGSAGKFIKEISFTKAQRGENVYCKVHTAKLFSLGRFLQTIQIKNRQSILVNR